MAIKARDDVTLASITDVSYTRRYYLLQSSTLNPPAAPTVNPAPAPWATTEPSYTEGSTNTLYTVDLTVFTDASFDYSQVSKSSSYEAAKTAYNKAVAAQSAANAAQTTANGKNKITRSTAVASGAGVAGDQWWQYSGSQVIGFWIHNGTSWVSQTLTDSVITNLNAGTITAGTLNADRIGANSITTAKIAANAVTANEIAANSITATNGIVQSLDAGKITVGTLGADRIAANSITAAKLVAGTITASSGVIANLAITNAMIANGAIQNAKIANLDAGKINTGTLNAARIAANSITASKLSADVFNGRVFNGSVFNAGGGTLPQVLVGPASGIPGTGDTYGMKITTPNNGANGSAVLAVAPAGPFMEFYDGAGKQVFAADKTGVRVVNQISGGMVDISRLAANTSSWVTNDPNFKVQFATSPTGDNIWSSASFFRKQWAGIDIGAVTTVNTPTGKLMIQGGVYIDQPSTVPSTSQPAISVQWGIYDQDPTGRAWDRWADNLVGGSGRAECNHILSRMGYRTNGSEIVNLTPNKTYWVAPIYWTANLGTAMTLRIFNLWVSCNPIT